MACSSLVLQLLTWLLLVGCVELSMADSGGAHQEHHLDMDALSHELQHLAAQLSSLERSLLEKDSSLLNLDKVIATLQDKLQTIQEWDNNEVAAMLGSTNEKLEQLEVKAKGLEESLKEKGQELLSFKDRVQTLEAAEKRHISEYKHLEKVSTDQQKRIERVEKSLRLAQEALTRAQAQIHSKEQELSKVYTQWLPPWTAEYVSHLQGSLSKYWSGRPLFDPVIGEISEKTLATQRWLKGHLETIKVNIGQSWSVLKGPWEKAMSTVGHQAETLRDKATECFEAAKTFLLPHLTKAQKRVMGVLQATKDLSGPYMDKAIEVLQPHLNKAQQLFKPYTGKITRYYRKSVKHATKYHLQVQRQVRKTLKKNKYLASIASKELVWFLASALLIMPLYGILVLLSSVFGGQKHSKSAKGGGLHAHGKGKRPKKIDK